MNSPMRAKIRYAELIYYNDFEGMTDKTLFVQMSIVRAYHPTYPRNSESVILVVDLTTGCMKTGRAPRHFSLGFGQSDPSDRKG